MKIEWRCKNLNGNLSTLGDVLKRMPRLQVPDLSENEMLAVHPSFITLLSPSGKLPASERVKVKEYDGP